MAYRWRYEAKNLCSDASVVRIAAKNVISRRRKDENDCEM